MQTLRLGACLLSALAFGVPAGCGERDVVKEVCPEVLRFADRHQPAVRLSLEAQKGRQGTVMADFNRDGHEDMAVVEQGTDGGSQVTLYIRNPPEAGSGEASPLFYRAGSIKRRRDAHISGVMSRKRSDLVDLVVLYTYPGTSSNELVQYRNNGKALVEILHQRVFQGGQPGT